MRREQSERLAASIVEFCRFLRSMAYSTTCLERSPRWKQPKPSTSKTRKPSPLYYSQRCVPPGRNGNYSPSFSSSSGANRDPSRELPRASARDFPKGHAGAGGSSTVFIDQLGNEGAARDGKAERFMARAHSSG